MSASEKRDPFEVMLKNSKLLFRPVKELWHGTRTNSIPWAACGCAGLFVALLIVCRWDAYLFRHLGIAAIYPRNAILHGLYIGTAAFSGFFGWAIYRAGRFNQLARKLELAMITSGLKNRLGNTPKLVGDWPVDENTRKLRVTSANFPRKEFDVARPGIETALRVYVDEIREDRGAGSFDFIYSRVAMPSSMEWPGTAGLRPLRFYIGKTRSKTIIGKLRDTPHLLVAGQTGGGKSTFLRQLITTLYVTDSTARFYLVDLKGGLEFQLFERLERAKVFPDIKTSVNELKNFDDIINKRMETLKAKGVKDIDALLQVKKKEKETVQTSEICRHIVVIDEATEMFLAGAHAQAGDIQTARRILSQIARQGRAVGIHLVIATQRPDSRALDPQVKANLTGILCFQMANDASSLTVLGNGRATDLPPVPGRAIWKSGIEMIEVQTPLLSMETAEALLQPLRIEPVTPTSAPKGPAANSDQPQAGNLAGH